MFNIDLWRISGHGAWDSGKASVAAFRLTGWRSPSHFHSSLGHPSLCAAAEHYLDCMFTFGVEEQDFGLKPMNCPGHCLMFDNKARSYKGACVRVCMP